MKSEWKRYSFRDLGRVFNGNSISENDKKAYFQGLTEGVPYIGTKDVSFDHEIRYESGVRIPDSRRDNFKLALANTILVCAEGGSAGRKIAHTDKDIYFGNKLFAICPTPPTSSRFVFYYCLSDAFAKQFKSAIAGLIGGVSLNKFKELSITLPPLSEQKRIARLLDEALDDITTAKNNAAKNRQNAHGLFGSHLQSVFIERDSSWKAALLTSVLSEQPRNGWSPPAEHQTGKGNPVLTLSAVTGFKYDGSRVRLSSAPTREGAHYWLKAGELLMTRSNTQDLVGHVAICDGTPKRAICCDLIMKMMVNPSKALTRFIYFYLRSPEARYYVTSRAHGASSTMKKIGKQVVQNIPIPLPSIAQQTSIVAKFDALLAETQHLESIYQKKLAALDSLKKSLLHQAFTGQL